MITCHRLIFSCWTVSVPLDYSSVTCAAIGQQCAWLLDRRREIGCVLAPLSPKELAQYRLLPCPYLLMVLDYHRNSKQYQDLKASLHAIFRSCHTISHRQTLQSHLTEGDWIAMFSWAKGWLSNNHYLVALAATWEYLRERKNSSVALAVVNRLSQTQYAHHDFHILPTVEVAIAVAL